MNVPVMLSARADAPTAADTEGTPAFHLHPLRTRGRMFRRSVGTLPQLRAGDETSNGHGATAWRRLCARAWLVDQETFVAVAVTDASNVVWIEDSADWVMVAGTIGCSMARAARTAASILERTFRARRVRFTSRSSTLAPVVRIRDLAVGPSANSNITHARDMPVKIAPAVEFAHNQSEAPSAPSNMPGIIGRNSHKRLGQTATDSKSRK